MHTCGGYGPSLSKAGAREHDVQRFPGTPTSLTLYHVNGYGERVRFKVRVGVTVRVRVTGAHVLRDFTDGV